MHNAGAGHGADGLVLVREISGEHFGRAGSLARIPGDKTERLIPCCEKFDKFVANGAACSKYGDHSDPAFRAHRKVTPPEFDVALDVWMEGMAPEKMLRGLKRFQNQNLFRFPPSN